MPSPPLRKQEYKMQNPHDANVLQYFDYIVKNITLGSLLASVKQLAQVRNRPQGVVRNEIARGTCPVPTFLDGGRRVATVLACARWLAEQDGCVAAMPPTPKRRGPRTKAERIAAGGAA